MVRGSLTDKQSQCCERETGLRSKTPLEGFSVFLCYETTMCETEIKHPRVPFSNASQGGEANDNRMRTLVSGRLRQRESISLYAFDLRLIDTCGPPSPKCNSSDVFLYLRGS